MEAEIGKYYETPDYISHTDTRKGAMNNIYHYVRSYMLDVYKRQLLTRQMNGDEAHDTYTVYDNYGNVRFVLPPLAADSLTAIQLSLIHI